MLWHIVLAVARRVVEPLLAALTGALLAVGLTVQSVECVDLVARELLGLKPSASSLSLNKLEQADRLQEFLEPSESLEWPPLGGPVSNPTGADR